ncbi:MAG: HAD-IA family hydrolase [Treponema sp.]|jgi:putative hydrolase of the HAD superfamily|nr:HAD-IA family hydrolase [Treponema sp.]
MITHILFDLDNTLYSAAYGLEDRVYQRLITYAADFLGVSIEEAAAMRGRSIAAYGTTLEWLMAEKGFSGVEEYLRVVHPEDEADALRFDPGLRPFLESLDRPLAILTNSPMFHAERILDKLRVRDLFPRVFDIWSNGLKGKPEPAAFYRALDALGATPESTLFIDDNHRYVAGYNALGGRGLFLDEFDEMPQFPGPRITRLAQVGDFVGE